MAISVVQHVGLAANATSGTTITLAPTFGSTITSGNMLVAVISWLASDGSGQVGSVTTNGSAENWAASFSLQGASNPQGYIWINPNTSGGTKIVDVNLTSMGTATTSASSCGLVDVYEVSGITTSTPLDRSLLNESSGVGATTWTSNATAATRQAVEFQVGAALVLVAAANTTTTVTGPGGWTNETTLATSIQAGGTTSAFKFNVYQLSGFLVTSSAGTATYSGSTSASCDTNAAVATYWATPPSPSGARIITQAVKRAAYY